MLSLLWSSISSTTQSFLTTQEMSTLTQLTKLSVVYSELVHELQKERGMTAGYLSSKGNKFASKLKSQRSETNMKKLNYLIIGEKVNLNKKLSNYMLISLKP